MPLWPWCENRASASSSSWGAKPVFTLRLVWASLDHSPEWELETEHGYFANWAIPASLAEGHTSPHPRLLELRRGRMFLRLNDGAVLELGDDGSTLVHRTAGTNAGPKADPTINPGLSTMRVIAQDLSETFDTTRDDDLVGCEDYGKVHGATPADLSRSGLGGEWHLSAYEVGGPRGPLSVVMELDDTRNAVVARLEGASSAQLESAKHVIIIAPKP